MMKFTQKLIQKALVVAFTVGMIASANAQFAGGSGSDLDPWLISNADELLALRTAGDWKFYKLSADIDMTGVAWTPYKSPNHGSQSRISIDGDNHVIRNLTITAEGNLVGFVKELTGYIKNLGFENLNIDAADYINVGGIVGQVWDNSSRSLENCYVKGGKIIGKENVGGLVGFAFTGNTTIKNCFADVEVEGKSGVGGLFARLNLTNASAVENCAFYGTITFPEDSTHNGGGAIAGDVWKNSTEAIGASMYYNADLISTEDQGNATAIAAGDLATQASYPALDFSTPMWKMGTEYAVLNWVSDVPTGVETSKEKVSFSVYPNPANDVINIKGDVEEVTIYSSTGAMVKTVYKMNVISVEDLETGLYFVRIISGKEKFMQRVIVQ